MVALTGGKRKKNDGSPQATALRELSEETAGMLWATFFVAELLARVVVPDGLCLSCGLFRVLPRFVYS